jgi:quercetin dioxygenase-like cupin family protein
MKEVYGPIIESLPDADIPVAGVRGKLLQSEHGQLVFFEIEPWAKIPDHSHGAQWGTVIQGEMSLTISGQTKRYKPGETYFIPAGAVHGAVFHTRTYVVDLFADIARYKTKPKA